jgi:hypothetical protein
MSSPDSTACGGLRGDWLDRLLTHPVKGLDNFGELCEKLTAGNGAIKVFCRVED